MCAASKNSYICENHFEKSNIGKKYLKKNVVPSLLIENDTSPSFLFSGKTYSGSRRNHDTADFTLEEFENYNPDLSNINSQKKFQNNITSCTYCLKSTKNMIFYKTKFEKIFHKYLNLKKSFQKIKSTNSYAINSVRQGKLTNLKLQAKKTINTVIDELPQVSANSKILAKTVLESTTNFLKWDENSRILAQNMHYVSPAAYKFLRNHLKINLPTLSSIYRWIP